MKSNFMIHPVPGDSMCFVSLMNSIKFFAYLSYSVEIKLNLRDYLFRDHKKNQRLISIQLTDHHSRGIFLKIQKFRIKKRQF